MVKRITNKVLAGKRTTVRNSNGEKTKAFVTNLKNANVIIKETDDLITIIINDKLLLRLNADIDYFPLEKTNEGFKSIEGSQTVYYKQEKPGSLVIHREDGPAVFAEDFDDYRWYYEGKWIKGLRKKEATPEEYSMYVFEQFMKEK